MNGFALCLVIASILFTACSGKEQEYQYIHNDIDFNEVSPPEVYQAAIAGIPTFMQVDSSQVTLGTAFRMYTIRNAALADCNPPNVASLLISYDIWNIIATYNNTRSILKIERISNEWTLVGVGTIGLPDLIEEARSVYSQYTPIFIKSHEPDLLFFTLPELGDSNMTWFLLYPPRPLTEQTIKSLPEAMAYLNPACAVQ